MMELTMGKKILVTGGAGFIGSNFLNYTVPKYQDTIFINIDALTYAGNLDNVTVSASPNYVFEKMDIRDPQRVQEAFEKYAPTMVVHLAAESHVDNSIESPNIFAETNVLGTQHLLQASVTHKIERFLYVSTDEVYGSLDPQDPPSKESNVLKPNSPYSASKAAGEMFARAYAATFKLPILITRCGNNYGPRQHREKLIPRSIQKLLAEEDVAIYGNGKNVRDWIHVLDHVKALDLVLRKGVAGEIYNIGSSNELSNNDIARKLLALSGNNELKIEYVADRPGHDFRYALDTTKIKNELGWFSTIPFEKGLRETFEWYKGSL